MMLLTMLGVAVGTGSVRRSPRNAAANGGGYQLLPFNVGTLLVQWGIVLAAFLLLNGRLVRRLRPPMAEGDEPVPDRTRGAEA